VIYLALAPAHLGVTFRSEMFAQVLNLWDTVMLNPPVYYPQPQGQAERHMSAVKSFIERIGCRWHQSICWLGLAHNASPIAGSQVTPYDLVLGSTPRSLVDTLSWDQPNELLSTSTFEVYHQKLVESIELVNQYHKVRIEELRQNSRDSRNLASRFYNFEVGQEVIYCTDGALGEVVHGIFTIDSKDNEEGTIFTLSNGSTVSVTQIVPYYRDLQPLRSSVHSAEVIFPQLDSLVLIRRPDGLIDVGKCIDCIVDVQTISYTVFSYENGKWVENPSAVRTCTFSEVLYTGFKLTRNSQFRTKDRKIWRSKGWEL
jgi:hypothetical protein